MSFATCRVMFPDCGAPQRGSERSEIEKRISVLAQPQFHWRSQIDPKLRSPGEDRLPSRMRQFLRQALSAGSFAVFSWALLLLPGAARLAAPVSFLLRRRQRAPRAASDCPAPAPPALTFPPPGGLLPEQLLRLGVLVERVGAAPADAPAAPAAAALLAEAAALLRADPADVTPAALRALRARTEDMLAFAPPARRLLTFLNLAFVLASLGAGLTALPALKRLTRRVPVLSRVLALAVRPLLTSAAMQLVAAAPLHPELMPASRGRLYALLGALLAVGTSFVVARDANNDESLPPDFVLGESQRDESSWSEALFDEAQSEGLREGHESDATSLEWRGSENTEVLEDEDMVHNCDDDIDRQNAVLASLQAAAWLPLAWLHRSELLGVGCAGFAYCAISELVFRPRVRRGEQVDLPLLLAAFSLSHVKTLAHLAARRGLFPADGIAVFSPGLNVFGRIAFNCSMLAEIGGSLEPAYVLFLLAQTGWGMLVRERALFVTSTTFSAIWAVWKIMEATDGKEVVVFGVSCGALVGVRYLRQHPRIAADLIEEVLRG